MVTEKATRLPPVPESLPDPENSSTSEWVAISFDPKKTSSVEEQFRVMQVETVIPGENVLPRYLFALFDTNSIPKGWISSLNGVKGIVTFGEDYGRVPNSVIEVIKNALRSDDPAERLKEVFDQELSPEQRILAILEVRPLRPA